MKIFISYRRKDTPVITGRIYDKLIAEFGDKNIFRDIDSIEGGRDFTQELKKATREADIVLVVIGPTWAGIKDDKGNKRLDSPNDFVRREVEAGLRRKQATVIPLLVLGATMPAAEDLPESLRPLTVRNAMQVRDDPDFHHDMERVIRSIKGDEKQPGQRKPAPVRSSGEVFASFSLYAEANQNSLIKSRPSKGTKVTILEENEDGSWVFVKLDNREQGWALKKDLLFEKPRIVSDSIAVGSGFGAQTKSCALYFTNPVSKPDKKDRGYGIDIRLADAIGHASQTLDIAAFEINNKLVTEAILEAPERGVQTRIVLDAENGFREGGSANRFIAAGIPIVSNQGISTALMHHKFMILDGKTVWTGSWNYTEGSTYKNNENALVFEDPGVSAAFQTRFNAMFEENRFSRNAPKSTQNRFSVSGIPVEVYFTPSDPVEEHLVSLIGSATRSIHFMAFSFTNENYTRAIQSAIGRGVPVQGIIESMGAKASAGQFSALQRAGVDVRSDSNPYFLHHTVIIVDQTTCITGSLTFTKNALERNDENVVIVHDPGLAKHYLLEFIRLWPKEKPQKDE
jgi:phosphatidylserine/phosphatidylglycerophosphate/cardiolipin synthase-like enzyme